jgi:hypothetical protein
LSIGAKRQVDHESCVYWRFGWVLMLGAFDSGVQTDSAVDVASYYKSGKITANGEPFNPNGITAAHRNLPFGTKVHVTNLSNGKNGGRTHQ